MKKRDTEKERERREPVLVKISFIQHFGIGHSCALKRISGNNRMEWVEL